MEEPKVRSSNHRFSPGCAHDIRKPEFEVRRVADLKIGLHENQGVPGLLCNPYDGVT